MTIRGCAGIAVHALGEIGGATSTRVLRQALLDEDPAVRQAAAELLEQASAMPGH
jgi:HEAT repeat protein